MDIDVLIGLQNFRNGAGSFLSDFFSKMTFFGELNTLIKEWIPGSVGTVISCFMQMFYVTFLFPLCIRFLEGRAKGTAKANQ